MKWFSCRQYRKGICLLAGGGLPESEAGEVRAHLAACPKCRQYYAQIKAVTEPLAIWPETCPQVEPSAAARKRWTEAILQSDRSEPERRFAPRKIIQQAWRELFWPCRHAWTGMAALWLLMMAINIALNVSSSPRIAGDERFASAPAFFHTFEEQRRILAELTQALSLQPAAPPRGTDNRPRSERARRWDLG